MVKKMDNYSQRSSDKRFEKFDRLIEPNSNDKKITAIITIGVIVSLILMGSSLITESQKPAALKYAQGLNISYNPETSLYYIDYTNPQNDTESITIDVRVPLSPTEYISAYNTQITKFPSNTSYKPSNTDVPHTVSVNIIKSDGNYTYFFVNTPMEEDKLYEGFYKYTNPLTTVIK
jgi:hypothetical protein